MNTRSKTEETLLTDYGSFDDLTVDKLSELSLQESIKERNEQLLALAKYMYWNFDDACGKNAEDYLEDFLNQQLTTTKQPKQK